MWGPISLSFTCERLKLTCDESQLTRGAIDQLEDRWTKLGLLPQNQFFLEKSRATKRTFMSTKLLNLFIVRLFEV